MPGTPDMPFRDPVSGRPCKLVIGIRALGVQHPDCVQLADVSPELDAFYCPACKFSGRVSGTWVAEQIERAWLG